VMSSCDYATNTAFGISPNIDKTVTTSPPSSYTSMEALAFCRPDILHANQRTMSKHQNELKAPTATTEIKHYL